MRDFVSISDSFTPDNRPRSSNNRISSSSRERSIYEPQSRDSILERQRYDESRSKFPRRCNGSNPDPRNVSRVSASDVGSHGGYSSQWNLMVNMIRDTNLTYNEFQRSYSEKLNTAIARYPEQSKDWQLWYAEGVVWESHFSGKKFPGKEPYKVSIVPSAHSTQSEPYFTIESFMEAKALKGGFRKSFFKALNAKRHEVNDRQPSAERHKKAFWVDNEIWSHFWPNEPFPIKDPSIAETPLTARPKRPPQKQSPLPPPPVPLQPERTLRRRDSQSTLQPQPQPQIVKQEVPSSTNHQNPTVSKSQTPKAVIPATTTQTPKAVTSTTTTQTKTNISNPTVLGIFQGSAPAYILQGLLETQKNWQSKSPVNGRIIMINRNPVICNDNPNLPREIFHILKSEDDQRGWEVQTGIGCNIHCTSVSTGDLLLWTTPLGDGGSITEEIGNQFLQGWIQRILTHGIVTMSSHWKDLQSHSSNQYVMQQISTESEGEDSKEEYKTTFRASDLDMMVIEETAKVEGNLRLVLDEETGEVITLAELIKRSKQRCLQGFSILGAKRKAERIDQMENKRPCP